MRVALLTNTEEACGIASYSRSLGDELARLVDLDVVPTWRQTQPWDDFIRASLPRLNNCDVVHIQHEYSFWGSIIPQWGRFAGRFVSFSSKIKPPIVLTAHTLDTVREMFGLDKPGSGYRRTAKKLLGSIPLYRDTIERKTFDVADFVLIHDPSAASRLKVRRIAESKIRIIPMGVPTIDPNAVAGLEFSEKYGLVGKRLVVVFGFVRPGRGYEIAMDVLSEMESDYVLVIAGGPQTNAQTVYMNDLLAKIEDRGMKDRVVVTGYLSDAMVGGAMRAADVVLCSQEAGTGSYSVQIALAYGRPILASDLPCFTYPSREHGCLMTYDRTDPTDMKEKLKLMLEDENLRDKLSVRAIAYADEHTWAKIAERTVQVYREAVSAE